MTLSVAMFEPHVGSAFFIPLNSDEQAVFMLDRVEDKTDPKTSYASFSLFFSADAPFLLPQGAYPLQHAVLDEQFIFLVPVSREGSKVIYQACFNVEA
ncbi:MAG: hypothetical protein JO218_08065 [Burkholderiales bacterium]|nr:hypothetical protein [Burkholderiales bacterium]